MLPSFGIWRPIRVVAYDVRLKDVLILQDHSKRGQAALSVPVEIDGPAAGAVARCRLTLKGKLVGRARGPHRRGKGNHEIAREVTQALVAKRHGRPATI